VIDQLVKAVPQDHLAEEATVGSLILERDGIVKVAPLLRPADFHCEVFGWIYEAILALYERREPPDAITLSAELERRGRLSEVGGYSELIRLVDRTPTAVHVEHYARIVSEKAARRRLISAGGAIAALGYTARDTLEELEGAVQNKLAEVFRQSASQDFRSMEELTNLAMDRLDAIQENRELPTGVPSGFSDLDEYTGGFHRGDLIILAARPSVGKSALSSNIAQQAASRTRPGDSEGHHVGVFSLEMSQEQVYNRYLSAQAYTDGHKLRMGRYLTDQEHGRIASAYGVLSALPIWVNDTAGLTIQQIRAKAHQLHASVRLDLLIVDYLQLVEPTLKKGVSREQQVAEVARGLKALARELRIPVLACAQLSRGNEKRPSKVPILSDLRESGGIENDADLVIFIHRPGMYPGSDVDKSKTELHIAKSRNGALGSVLLRFDGPTTQFVSTTRREI
jgi:replicative DNA helicase